MTTLNCEQLQTHDPDSKCFDNLKPDHSIDKYSFVHSKKAKLNYPTEVNLKIHAPLALSHTLP